MKSPKIRLNTIGYLPGKEKKASVAAECSRFAVVRVKDNEKVLEGTATGPVVKRGYQGAALHGRFFGA